MANNMVKFYKVASLPSTLVPGAIYFVTTTQSIHVATSASAADKFGIGLKDASLADSKLTITRYDGTTVEVDFSDIASASSVVAALALKADKTQVAADITAAQAAAIAAAKVKDVDTTATNGVNLFVDANGKLDVTVAPGQVADGNASVVTGDEVYDAIENAKTELNEKLDNYKVKTVTEGVSVENFVTLTVTEPDTNGGVKISIDDSALNTELTRVAGRIDTFLDSEDINTTVDTLHEIQNWMNTDGVNATELTTAISETKAVIDDYTVNAKKISGNPVLDGADIKLDGYTKGSAEALKTTDTINTALGKLEARVDAAAAGGVQTVGGKAGAITLDTDATGEGNVKFAISEAGEISATVNIGATAEQGDLAESAVQAVYTKDHTLPIEDDEAVNVTSEYVERKEDFSFGEEAEHVAFIISTCGDISDANVDVKALADAYAVKTYADAREAAAKAYTDSALTWVEFN